MNDNFLTRWLKHVPIVIIGSLVTLVLGTAVWLVLDNVQNEKVKALLNKDIERALDDELSAARIRLNNYFDGYINFSYILAHKIESHHLSLKKVARSKMTAFSHNHDVNINAAPDWGLEDKFLDYHFTINYALLFDDQGHLYELLESFPTQSPLNFKNFDPYLINLSLDTSYMLEIENTPVIISSRSLTIGSKQHFLMIVKIIDDQFLLGSQKKALTQGKVIAIFDSESHKVIASTAPATILSNSTVNKLTKDYTIIGKQFFDNGNSELEVQFALLIPNNLYESLSLELLSLDRENRLIIIFAMSSITFFGLLILVRSIIKLANIVSHHSSKTFHSVKSHEISGNEFHYLKTVFNRFALRALTDKQIDEQLFTSKAKSLQLSVLSGITNELNVGVIIEEDNQFRSFNRIMDGYAYDCGNLDLFTQKVDLPELSLIDSHHKRRVFKRSFVALKSNSKAIIIQDITERYLHAIALKEMALHDPLTGLPNRILLNDRISSGIQLSKRENKPCLLLMMDLNRFKNVNDTLGHSTGDELLKQVAKRMSEEIRATDTLSRIGGDEFAILLVNSDLEWSKKIAVNLKKALTKPFKVMNNVVEIGVSIGIAPATNNITTEELLSQADIAMYHAKREQLEYCIYNADIDPAHSDRKMIIDSIRAGIDKHEFELYYQPQISPTDNTFLGFEALVRWVHPKLGFLPPDVFISLAEENGYINELTQVIFLDAAKQCEQWLKQGYRIHLSINLSAANLQDISLLPFISRILEKSTIDPSQLTLEITESMLMQDQTNVTETLNQIKSLGMRLSIDDFGTGYSSLAYLRHMPVDELKIDRSFISDIANEYSDIKLIHSIIDLAHNLDLEVVAEGIETDFQQQMLSNLNCERLQGYLYSKPMPKDKVVSWIKDNIKV